MSHLLRTKVFRQAAGIIILACISGIIYNFLSPHGIPFISFQEEIPRINLSKAKEIYETGRAIFLDARTEEEFVKGHIKGALNLPSQDFDDKFLGVAEKLNLEVKIVTYCDGRTCESSTYLADRLKKMGFKDVNTFAEGFPEWLKAGLAVEKGRL